MKEMAIADTKDALEHIDEYRNLLHFSLHRKYALDWDKLYNKDSYQDEEHKLETFIELVNVPKEDKFIEFFFSSVTNKRLAKQKEAERQYHNAYSDYHNAKNKFLNEQKEINESVDQFKHAYEESIPPFVERYFGAVINHPPTQRDKKKIFMFNMYQMQKLWSLILIYLIPKKFRISLNINLYKPVKKSYLEL
ncbi:hypothetical protein [Neobacillus vireti]|uniref:hypothetical protein n=1 Tax=Neobacillus vireti TaxID=220686 RepID=UPI003000F4D3